MDDYIQLLTELLKEEEELQFTQFTNEMAYQIGCRIVEKASVEQQSITVDISRNGQQLFHCSLTGRSMDSGEWVKRKRNVVQRFGHSSYYMGTALRAMKKSIQERYCLNPAEYAASGGAFPIIIRNVGMVGCVSVSGLSQEEDHNIVTSVLREFITT